MNNPFKKLKCKIEQKIFYKCTKICSKNGYMCVPYSRTSEFFDRLGLKKVSITMELSPELMNRCFLSNEDLIKRMKYKLASDVTNKLMPMVKEKYDEYERPYLSLDIYINQGTTFKNNRYYENENSNQQDSREW